MSDMTFDSTTQQAHVLFNNTVYKIGDTIEIEDNFYITVESIIIKPGNQIYYSVWWLNDGNMCTAEFHRSEVPARKA